MSCHVQYASLFVRLWKVFELSGGAVSTVWQSEVEHVQSGKSWVFNSMEGLVAFLQQLPEDQDDLAWIELPGIDPPTMHTRDGIEQVSAEGGLIGDENGFRIDKKKPIGL